MFGDLNAMVVNNIHQTTSIVAINGIPIFSSPPEYYWMSQEVTIPLIRKVFLEGLGLGAVLTYKNPKGKSLLELGEMCLKLNHTWTFHNLSLTICFRNVPIVVRNAFAFDTNFNLSWIESEINDETVTFTAAGSLKSWKKIVDRVSDSSFKPKQREAFLNVKQLIQPILPEYF